MPGAQVDRIAELERLKEAVVAFVEHARVALGSAEMEFGRLAQWIEHEAPYAWQRQAKQATEDISVWKAALFRKRLQRTDNYRPDTSEEEDQLQRAERRVAEAGERLEACKAWRRRLEQGWSEYQGSAGNLADQVVGDPPALVAELRRILAALESYRKLQGPGPIDQGIAPAGRGGPGTMANPNAAPPDAPAETPAGADASAGEAGDGP